MKNTQFFNQCNMLNNCDSPAKQWNGPSGKNVRLKSVACFPTNVSRVFRQFMSATSLTLLFSDKKKCWYSSSNPEYRKYLIHSVIYTKCWYSYPFLNEFQGCTVLWWVWMSWWHLGIPKTSCCNVYEEGKITLGRTNPPMLRELLEVCWPFLKRPS